MKGAHHLAAVAHAEGERVLAGEEGGKLGAGAFVEENALSFRRKPEYSSFKTIWMPDQVRHDREGV